jgi:hypothetical protein
MTIVEADHAAISRAALLSPERETVLTCVNFGFLVAISEMAESVHFGGRSAGSMRGGLMRNKVLPQTGPLNSYARAVKK